MGKRKEMKSDRMGKESKVVKNFNSCFIVG